MAKAEWLRNLFRSRKLEELKASHAKAIADLEALHVRELARLNRALGKQERDSENRLADLREAVAKAEHERDYFRGKSDRFELLLLTPRTSAPTVPRRHTGEPTPITGRKTWLQVQMEDLARQDEELKKKADAQGKATQATGPATEQSA